jgi:hypothetical protein
MRDEEFDRILGDEADLPPSPGFHAAVMRAIHREATTPPPIPFPWKRAWPALAAAVVVFMVSPVLIVQSGSAGLPSVDSLIPVAESVGAPWISLAALATAGSLLLTRRLCE